MPQRLHQRCGGVAVTIDNYECWVDHSEHRTGCDVRPTRADVLVDE
jgi:hypothetical protein